MEFSYKKWQSDAFWSSYVKMEQQKFRLPKDNDEVDDGQDDPYGISRLLRRITAFVSDRLYDSESFLDRKEPLLFLHRLVYWARRSVHRRDDNTMDKRTFQLLYIEKAKIVAFMLLLFNIVLLGVTIAYFDGWITSLDSTEGARAFSTSGKTYTAEWLFCNCLSLVCLAPFVFLTKIQQDQIFGHDLVDSWVSVGYIIIAVRVMRTVSTISHGYLEGEQCFGLHELSSGKEEYGFRYIFFQIMQDCSQVFVLCALPFSWPWSFILSSEVLVDGILRAVTCKHLMEISPENQVAMAVGYISFKTGFCYLSVAMVSLNFQRSIRASSCHAEDQKTIAQETKKIVDLLCSDVKVLLRQGSRVLSDVILQSSSMDTVVAEADDAMAQRTADMTVLRNAKKQVQQASESVLAEVDNLLFLAKLGEGRFDFSRDVRVDVARTIVAAVKDVRTTIQQMNADIHVDIMCAENQLVSTDSRCLQVLTFFSLMALYYYRHQRLRDLPPERHIASILHVLLSFELQEKRRGLSIFPGKDETNHRILSVKLEYAPEMFVGLGQGDESASTLATHTLDEEIGRSHRSHENNQYDEPFQSICVVCKKLAEACEGDFEVRSEAVVIALPVVLLEAESARNVPGNSTAKSLSSISSGKMDAAAAAAAAAATAKETYDLIREHVSAYVTEAHLEGLFMDVLAKIPGGLQIALHRELNLVDLKIRSVVVVQSLDVCKEIRRHHFTGKLVLFTERLAYLDKQERALFDFALSLPPTDEDVAHFVRFVEDSVAEATDKQQKHVHHRHPLESHTGSDNQSIPSSVPTSKDSSSDDEDEQLNLVFAWISTILNALRSLRSVQATVPSIGDRTFDYARWRFINPAGDLSHHTTLPEVVGMGLCVYYAIHYYLELYNALAFFAIVIQLVLLIERPLCVKLLRRVMSYTSFWYLHGWITLCMSVSSLGNTIRNYLNGTSPAASSSTVNEFLNSQASGVQYSGKQQLFYIIGCPTSFAFFGVFLPVRMAVICQCTLFIRCLLLVVFFQSFVELSYVVLAAFEFCALCAVIFAMVLYMEGVLRHEFLQLHALVMDRAYLESCLTLVRHINPSLQRVLSAQQDTLDVLLEASVAHRIGITESLLQSIHQLQHHLAMGRQLSLEMAIIDDVGFFGVHKTDVLDRMHATLLQPVVAAACARYAEDCAASGIGIHVRIAPELLVLRVDPAVVDAIVSKLCQQAIKRIQHAITTSRRQRRRQYEQFSSFSSSRARTKTPNAAAAASVATATAGATSAGTAAGTAGAPQANDLIRHHILVVVEPQVPLPGKVYRFMDVRRMRILVMDSAPGWGEDIDSVDDGREKEWWLPKEQQQQQQQLQWGRSHSSTRDGANQPNEVNDTRVDRSTSWTQVLFGRGDSGAALEAGHGIDGKLSRSQESQEALDTGGGDGGGSGRRGGTSSGGDGDDGNPTTSLARQLGVVLMRRRFVSLTVADKHTQFFAFADEDEEHWQSMAAARRDASPTSSSESSSSSLLSWRWWWSTSSSSSSSAPWIQQLRQRNRSRCEEGIVRRHGCFQTYQSAFLPYLQCAEAEKYRRHLRRVILNRMWRTETLSRRYYPHYLALHSIIRARWTMLHNRTLAKKQRSMQRLKRASSSSALGTMPLLPPDEAGQGRRASHRNLVTGATAAMPALQRQSSSSSTTSSTSASSSASSASSRRTVSTVGGDGSVVAVFVAEHGALRHQFLEIQRNFAGQRHGVCRQHELNRRVMQSFSMTDMALYTGHEVILLEYAPTMMATTSSMAPSTNDAAHASSSSSASAATAVMAVDDAPPRYGRSGSHGSMARHSSHNALGLTWSQVLHDTDFDRVRIVVHYLRLHGFMGLIVIVGPVLSRAAPLQIGRSNPRNDPGAASTTLQRHPSQSSTTAEAAASMMYAVPRVPGRDAVAADAYVPLPMTPEKIEGIVALKERRMIEVVLSA